jgi:hypothetical protein
MSRRVLFLGAGASAHFRYPTTAQLLRLILDKEDAGTLFDNDAHRRSELRQYLAQLMPGLAAWRSERQNGLPWITEILSLIDQLLLRENGISEALSHDSLLRCRALLEQALSEVLSARPVSLTSVPDEVQRDLAAAQSQYPHLFRREVTAAPDLARLVEWIDQDCTVITTNYDTLVESEVYSRVHDYHQVWKSVDFGFAAREPATGVVQPRPTSARFTILKLHGSLNWLRCPRCDRCYVNTFGPIAHLAFKDGRVTPENQCHCGYGPLRHVLVTPSFLRGVQDVNLSQIWQCALDALRVAEEWFIIGYSLPQEDVSIRSLLLRGFLARPSSARSPAVNVFLKDRMSEASYKVHFPNAIYETDGLKGFLERYCVEEPQITKADPSAKPSS